MAAQWQDKLRKRLGKDMKAASKKAGLGETAVRDVLERRPDPKLSTIAALAKAHHFSIDELLDLPNRHRMKQPNASIPIRGHVAAGVWLEVEAVRRMWDETLGEVPVAPDPRYPQDSIYGLIRDEEILICLDVKAGIEIADGDLVILKRVRAQDGLRQLMAKRFRRRASGIVELWPEAGDLQEPIILDKRSSADDELRVIARVEWIWKAATPHFGPRASM